MLVLVTWGASSSININSSAPLFVGIGFLCLCFVVPMFLPKPFRRRRHRFAVVATLFLVTTLLAWRSWNTPESWIFLYRVDLPAESRLYLVELNLAEGRFHVHLKASREFPALKYYDSFFDFKRVESGTPGAVAPTPRLSDRDTAYAGFGAKRYVLPPHHGIPTGGGIIVSAPSLLFPSVGAFLIFFMLYHSYRRTPMDGYCFKCGYDLRASKDKCPECGAKIPAEAALTHTAKHDSVT